jgi:hypothetical protein
MNLLERFRERHLCTEQLAQALAHERHLRQALRDQLLADAEHELAGEADLIVRASAALPSAQLDVEFLADRARVRHALDELATTASDGDEFERCACCVLEALTRHREHQERWLLPFLTAGLPSLVVGTA